MDQEAKANRETPPALRAEITRYGGLNPYGKPQWRVVLAQNVLEQCFGVMRHLPMVSEDADVTDMAPELIEEGEFWIPRYSGKGWILERWFPTSTWGDQETWNNTYAEDGFTRMMGRFPRHGDYYMVSTDFLEHAPPAAYWKREIQQELQRLAALPGNPATHLTETLYWAHVREERRADRYREEVNAAHRAVVDPMLATVGRTAQRVRDSVAAEMGLAGNLAAG